MRLDAWEDRDFKRDLIPPRSVAIRFQCLECVGEETKGVKNCSAKTCYLWPFRMGGAQDLSGGHKKTTRQKAIRKECLACMGGSPDLVRTCPSRACFLWPYRMGRGVCRDPEGKKIEAGLNITKSWRKRKK